MQHGTTSRHKRPYLQVDDNLAHDRSEVPGLRHVAEDSRRQTNNDDDKVRNRQIHDEQIGDRSETAVVPDNEADERVADDTDTKHHHIEHDETPFERRRPNVVVDHVEILLVADAILVATVDFRRVVRHVAAIFCHYADILCIDIFRHRRHVGYTSDVHRSLTSLHESYTTASLKVTPRVV